MITTAQVAEYLRAVQAHLDDLSSEVIEELTGGLAADLTDVAAESSESLVSRLGAPENYATELRRAADLPPRIASQRDTSGAWKAMRSAITSHPRYPALRELAQELRPLWWVARAASCVVALHMLFGIVDTVHIGAIFFFGVAGISIALGRRGNSLPTWIRFGVRAADLLAVGMAALLFFGFLISPMFGSTSVGIDLGPSVEESGFSGDSGLVNNGETVYNIFAYDAQGKFIPQVQLFDQEGKPLNYTFPVGGIYQGDDSTGGPGQVMTQEVDGIQLTNIFPRVFESPPLNIMTGAPMPRKPPFLLLPPLTSAPATASPSPTPMP